MTKAEKTAVIEELKEKFAEAQYFYVADSSTLTVAKVNELRGKLFEKGIEMRVVKNTLLRKALEAGDAEKGFTGLLDESSVFAGPTAILFTATANAPAKVIKEFRKANEKPLLKAAYIDTDVFVGDEQLETLSSLKSKEDLLGDVILLLQSPVKNVLGSLQSGGNTLSGLLKALEERGEN